MKNLTDIRYVKSLLSRHGFHFSKKLGQNFLIDPSVCPQIAEMGNAKAGQGILEIGPGIGTLTQQLAMRAERVTAVELDSRLFPILEETVGEFQNLHILSGDILKFSVPELLEQEFPGMPVSVCANLPYYITTPILMHLLESGADIETITVMVQKEVAEKLQAPVGSREAGAITVAVNFYGSVELLFPVQRDSFLPPPNVDSAVIQIRLNRRYDALLSDRAHFFSMVKNGFSQRRKTLSNSLASGLSLPKAEVNAILEKSSVPLNARAEQLKLEDFANIANNLGD